MTEVTITQAVDIRCADEVLGLLGISLPQPRWHDLTALLARHRTLTPAHAAGPVLLEALKAAMKAIEDDRGLDEAICCSGYMCGCQGSSHRQLLLHDLSAAITQAEGPQA